MFFGFMFLFLNLIIMDLPIKEMSPPKWNQINNLKQNLKSEAEQQWTEVMAACFDSSYISFCILKGEISEFTKSI